MSNAGNARNFKIDLRKFSEELVPEALLKLHKEVALDILRRLINKSPVGDPSEWKINKGITNRRKQKKPKGYVGGTFRGFWQCYVANDPGKGQDPPPKGTRPRSRQATETAGKRAIDGVKLGQTIYIVNGLPYATRLNTGWSQQAPAGFFELAVAEVSRKVAEDFAR